MPMDEDAVRSARGPFAGSVGHLDAPYWATPRELVEPMLDLAGLGPDDHLIDLGCGDGRIVIAAARRGAVALGIDLDPDRIGEAEAAARAAGLEWRARFQCKDLFDAPLGEASVVTVYLLSHVNRMLHGRLLRELRPGARIVSHAFPIADWPCDSVLEVDGRLLYLWTVPAAGSAA